MRIENLIVPFNQFKGAVDVELYTTDLHDYVVITDSDNPGMSITNAAEFYCPQIAERLGLEWKRCIFIESYPPRKHVNVVDPTFDLINFTKDPPQGRYYPHMRNTILVAELRERGWSPLPRSLAEGLRKAGLSLSRNIGKTGLFEPWENGEPFCSTITFYDGNRYYCDDTENYIQGRLIGIYEKESHQETI
jgi:hypothetical protein